MSKYVVLEKKVGQTPLQVVENYKKENPELINVPMAYAGRLDPMASGKLLVLIGDECKKQKQYHGLDKEYRFEVLLGAQSDTGDVLGLIEGSAVQPATKKALERISKKLLGEISLPYPKFSSKTVKGKPLHLWTLEGRLSEIEIPSAETTIHSLRLIGLREEEAGQVYKNALAKVNSLPEVTEESKSLGRDFRRVEVRETWQNWLEENKGNKVQIATFDCVASSGTYMRTLSEEIGRRLKAPALAYSIHRNTIGKYLSLPLGFGVWTKHY